MPNTPKLEDELSPLLNLEENNLALRYPELAREFDGFENRVNPDQVPIYEDDIQYFWICPSNHSYQATVAERIHLQRGCRYCTGEEILRGFNDLESQATWLLESYDYRMNPAPYSVYFQSSELLSWVCTYGHRWSASILNRHIENDQDCPNCLRGEF